MTIKRITTKNLVVGDEITLDSKPSKVLSIRKAWKAPEYIITFEFLGTQEITRAYHANTKWDVFSRAGA